MSKRQPKRKRKEQAHAIPMTEEPCPRCLALARDGKIRRETVQPLPAGAFAPEARDRSGPCCFDCQSADTVVALRINCDFEMARIAVGNDRQENLHLPGAPLGLVGMKIVRPSKPGDLDRHHAWLDRVCPDDLSDDPWDYR